MNLFSLLSLKVFVHLKFKNAEQFSTPVFAEPSPSVTSAELTSNTLQNTNETNRNRKVSGATRDAAAEKKRLVDKEYRKRCKVRPLFSSLFGFIAENQFNRFVNYNM